MNLGFYGHTNTIVFTYTKDGKFYKQAMLGGIGMMNRSFRISREEKSGNVRIGFGIDSSDSDEYRRDYYGLHKYIAANKKPYYGVSKYLGYEEGTTEGNILSATFGDADAPIDLLFVWDEGYGGLDIPKNHYTFWMSDKSLPDKAQLEKMSNSFLLLDAKVLRDAGAMISKKNSWEQTASELVAEIQNNPAISYLLNADRLMITFELDGAVIILPKNREGKIEASLILTHGEIEGAIASKLPHNIPGIFIYPFIAASIAINMIQLLSYMGINTLPESGNLFDTFIKAMGNELIIGNKDDMHMDIRQAESDAVKLGMILRSFLEGAESVYAYTKFVEVEADEVIDSESKNIAVVKYRNWPAFPIPIESNGKVPQNWTVINSVGNRQLSDVARDYVQNGATAIEGLPQLSLGKFTTVDRWEIESYQNIGNLILGYANGESTRPLSIAVFGSPGSGKSFGVTEIAKNILPSKIEKLEFNVSQFTGLSDLGVAFQKVRDTILGGKLPLVFFDEFDSDRDGLPLGWVKSFLMPMQDGKFRDDSGEHPLGRCILVFAGGTAASFEEFIKQDNNFKNIKGPDFISRLRGTIDVLGPNPKNDNDKNYILRRALLLRSLCERNNIASVSPSIIRAMLHVPEYKHGARSMEAILDMSRIDGNAWEPVSLPSRSQLSLHVDAEAFIRLVLGN